MLKSERDFRNYLAGAALAFGVVLLSIEIMYIILTDMTYEDMLMNDALLWNIIYSINLFSGCLGGYLVARHRQMDYIQTGTIVALLAYMFEVIYNLLFNTIPNNIWSCASLLLGGIIGAMFYRAKTEKARIQAKKPEEKPKTESEKKE